MRRASSFLRRIVAAILRLLGFDDLSYFQVKVGYLRFKVRDYFILALVNLIFLVDDSLIHENFILPGIPLKILSACEQLFLNFFYLIFQGEISLPDFVPNILLQKVDSFFGPIWKLYASNFSGLCFPVLIININLIELEWLLDSFRVNFI